MFLACGGVFEKGLKVANQGFRIPVTACGLLLEAPVDDGAQCGGNFLRHLIDLRIPAFDDRLQDLNRSRTGKGPLTADHLVQNRSERKDIGLCPDMPAESLLGRHIRTGPQHHSRNRQGRLGRVPPRLDQPCQAEIEDFRMPLRGNHDVRRLEIAVDHPGPVGGPQSPRDLHTDSRGPAGK